MSIRYGIDLVLQPSFTAKVYQTRQIVCGQYSSWAAEMQMLRMPLTPYFPCPDDRLPILVSQVESIASESADQKPYMLRRSDITIVPSASSVVMEFEAPAQLFELQRKSMQAAQRHSAGLHSSHPFRPAIALLEYGNFPEAILKDAARFAEGVASGLDLTEMAMPWRLLLTRYSSEAAGDDWSNGRWAADLSWRQLSSHGLYSHGLYSEVTPAFYMLSLVKEQGKEEGERRRGFGRFFRRG